MNFYKTRSYSSNASFFSLWNQLLSSTQPPYCFHVVRRSPDSPQSLRYEIRQLPVSVSVRHCSVVSKSYQRGRYLFKLGPLLRANLKSASVVINRSPAVRQNQSDHRSHNRGKRRSWKELCQTLSTELCWTLIMYLCTNVSYLPQE